MDVTLAAAGDVAAFERLVEATKRVVTSIALAVVRDVRASEDVAQDVYLQAWRDLRTLKNPDSFLPWIRQLTRNEALSFVRSRGRRARRFVAVETDAASSAPSVVDRAIAEEERLVLEEALAALPDDAREVLTLFYREGQSIRQVAQLLDLSDDAVKKRLERARVVLRKDIEERFASAVWSTAPTAAFTGIVVASIATLAPSTAAAAAVGGTAAKTGLGAIALTFAGPLIGLVGGLAGPVLGARRMAKGAKSAIELTEIRRHRNVSMLAVVVLVATTTAAPLAADAGYLPRAAAKAVILAMPLATVVFFAWATVALLPTVRRRVRDEAMAKAPAAHARRTWWRNYVAVPLAVLWVLGLYGYVLTR